jgi:hypothetical protein
MAGLVILGTLLASLVVARSRYLHQWALAGRQQEAVAAADQLLGNWWASPATLPRSARGELPEKRLRWQTSLLVNPPANELGVDVVRLEVFEEQSDRRLPLARVDVVLSRPEPAVSILGK